VGEVRCHQAAICRVGVRNERSSAMSAFTAVETDLPNRGLGREPAARVLSDNETSTTMLY